MPEAFDPALIRSSPLVACLDYHEAIRSTSDRALELAGKDDVVLPLLVLAERQTGGRGRGTNQWWAAEGSLTFSLLLDAAALGISSDRWPVLSLSTGLAICEALEEMVPGGDFGVKWPNDVFCAGKKLCGILIESPSASRGRIVVGIGLNVNNSFTAAPAELSASALIDHAQERLDMTDVLLAILTRLDERWRALASAGFGSQAEDFRRRCVLTESTIQILIGQRELTGRCLGIDDDGALLLQTDSGRERIISGSIVNFF